ncbi:DNA topoisomerase VI, b subunit, putative [Plasmodium ovale]|uniref:DNA topoisomerase VI, b subunit, putative n=1 Tax=Plasmodium ovale TaxID=36330 RepID=A0A1C3KTR3_PLAOA|nr:DNA topoisomerase VI, b subunit, putative [Plasmodium ovale]
MGELQQSSNSTYSFFFKNLSVTGFYEENALFMTVKELFDNSIDAVCSKKGNEKKEKRIEILIKEYNKNSSLYEIMCRDNGEGAEIKDLEKFSEMFLTSKENCRTTGKFGIGLKTILLYSFKTAYGFLHIKVKVEKKKIWDFMLVIDKDLNHTFVQNFKEYVDENWNWSTEISVILKIHSTYIYDKRIYFYIKLALLWKKDIHVKCYYDDHEELVYSPEEHLQDHENALLNEVVENSTNIFFRKNHLSSYNFHLNIYVNVRKSDKIIANVHNSNVGLVFLIRYVNSMPLFSNSTQDCSITKDFKNFLKHYGLQFGMDPFTVENLDEACLEDFSTMESFNDLKNIAHMFYVKKSEKSTWNIIILGIDVRGSDISFANLSKTCIKEGEYLSNLIKKCLTNLFYGIKMEYPQEFESFGDYQLRQALDIYGVQLASSLSKIILQGREEFKNKVFFLLNEKKKEYSDKPEMEKVSNFRDLNENSLTAELYHHIKEKILCNEKGSESINVKGYSSGRSNVSEYEDDAREDSDSGGADGTDVK